MNLFSVFGFRLASTIVPACALGSFATLLKSDLKFPEGM
jgi:hypothetical protein